MSRAPAPRSPRLWSRAVTALCILAMVAAVVTREASVRGHPTWPWAFLRAGD